MRREGKIDKSSGVFYMQLVFNNHSSWDMSNLAKLLYEEEVVVEDYDEDTVTVRLCSPDLS